MNYLNLSMQILDSPEVIGCEPIDRATWLFLLRYCAGQENSGRIAGCRQWADRKWQQLARITKEEVMRECELWSWDGDDLVVWGYPQEKQAEIAMLREAGRSGGMAKTQAKTEAARLNGSSGGRPKTQAEPKPNPSITQALNPSETQQNRIEENRIEENTTTTSNDNRDNAPPNGANPKVVVAGCDLDALNRISSNIRRLRPAWDLPLTAPEKAALVASRKTFEAIPDDGWATIRAYLAAKLPEGSPGCQPVLRRKMIDWIADVWQHAQQWERKQPKARSMPAPAQPRRLISREEFAAAANDS